MNPDDFTVEELLEELGNHAAEIEKLRAALETSNCPRPYGAPAEDNTVGACIKAGVCGCDNGAALASDNETKHPQGNGK